MILQLTVQLVVTAGYQMEEDWLFTDSFVPGRKCSNEVTSYSPVYVHTNLFSYHFVNVCSQLLATVGP